MPKHLLAILLALLALGGTRPAPAEETCRLLPELNAPGAWKLESSDAAGALAASADNRLVLTADSAPGMTHTLTLAVALPVPAWADDFSFDLQTGLNPTLVAVSVLVRDAQGRAFAFGIKPPYANSYHGEVNRIYTGQQKGKIQRCSLLALTHDFPDARKTIQPAAGARPQKPYTITGLRVEGLREKHHPAQPLTLRLQGFAFTALGYRDSALAYNLNGTEGFGERDGLPHLFLADLSDQAGRYEIRWSVRDRFEGVPYREGVLNAEVARDAQGRADPAGLAQRLDLPVEEEGTYWVAVRARITPPNAKEPLLMEKDLRLYVGKGKPAAVRTPLTQSTLPGLFCAPAGGSRILPPAAAELPLRVLLPSAPQAGEEVVVEAVIRTSNLGTERGRLRLSLQEGSLQLDGNAAVAALPLSGLQPGAYRVEAQLRQGAATLDRLVTLIGLRPAPDAPSAAPAPAGDWKAQVAENRAYFHLSPMIHSLAKNRPDQTRLDYFTNLMPQLPAVSRDFEYNIPWRTIEPLPGIFDWEEADRVMNLAGQLGLRTLFWPSTSEYPEWLPSDYCRDANGKQFFDFAYHFFGGRLNFSQSPRLRANVCELYRAVAERYRSHPAVDGYFLINELPGDAPFMGWIEGYDEQTLTNFRARMREQFPDLAALNRRWQTSFAAHDTLTPPAAAAPAAYWHDWLLFRAGGYDDYLRQVVEAIRQADPKHLIWVYGDFTGVRFRPEELRNLGCMLANGGSHDAIHPFNHSRKVFSGLAERTEDHWPGKWTGYFPTVLEASLFSMSYGGGGSMNCKSYLFSWIPGEAEPLKLDQLRRPPYSLDRYEALLPVWRELRATVRPTPDVIQVLDIESFFTGTRTMNRNGYWNGVWQLVCYRSHLNFAAAELATAAQHAKLLLLSKDRLEFLSTAEIERIKQFIHNGGWALLIPTAGRYCLDDPAQDWALLRELGFTPPTEQIPATLLTAPEAAAGDADKRTQPQIAAPFPLGGVWTGGGKSEGEILLATVSVRGATTPAVTMRTVGKGRAVMAWAGELPLGSEALLRPVAERAGAQALADADNPRLWTNLLHNPQTGAWYALAHTGLWGSNPTGKAADSVLRCRVPAGKYRVTELVTNQEVGEYSAEQLSGEGLRVSVPERDTRVFRFAPVP